MSRKSIHNVKNYNFSPEDELFLDTNIWMYIYGQHESNDPLGKVYSDALGRILNAKSVIYVDVLVVSEFINAFARMEWKDHEQFKEKPFKSFRNSREFKAVALQISKYVRKILNCCTPVESGFSHVDLPALFNDYAAGRADFNDQIIAALCKREALKLITHDGDFRNKDVFVITANKRLLK